MKRPTGLTVIGVLMVAVAALLSFACLAFFFIGVMMVTGGISSDPASDAITGMAIAGGFSLLILAAVAACLAIGVFEMREWAWSVSVVSTCVGLGVTAISLFALRGYVFIPVVPSVVCHLAVVATATWMLAYLLQPGIKKAFSASNA